MICVPLGLLGFLFLWTYQITRKTALIFRCGQDTYSTQQGRPAEAAAVVDALHLCSISDRHPSRAHQRNSLFFPAGKTGEAIREAVEYSVALKKTPVLCQVARARRFVPADRLKITLPATIPCRVRSAILYRAVALGTLG